MPTFREFVDHLTRKPSPRRSAALRLWPATVLLGGLLAAGCAFQVGGDVPRSTPENEPGPDTVIVRFLNLSLEEAVDVEFFATNDPVSVLPDDLLVPAFRVTSNIGVAGTGILVPGFEDAIEFPCTETLTIGTSGGRFLDNETGELLGTGTARWVQQSPLGVCGSEVTFVYAVNEGRFLNRLFVGPLVPQLP